MKENGNIKVIEPKDDFKRIHKSIIRNKNIDCLTLGIYCKIVVLGADWQLNIKGLSKILGVSDNKVRASIGILEREGYVMREANYHDNKLDGWVYNVYPEPLKDEERSRAGYKKNSDDLQIQCCAESSVTQNQTTLESDITENGEDNNNRLNIIEDLKNNKTNNKEKDNKLSSKKNGVGVLSEYDTKDIPQGYEDVVRAWCEYKRGRREKYKNQDSFISMVNRLVSLSKGNPKIAELIVLQSKANNYAGLFPLRSDSANTLPIGFKLDGNITKKMQSECNETNW